jgi:predicted phosphodiesterase
MRFAIVSDIHANLAALERVLDVIEKKGVDAVYCLGDTVGYGAHPNECVALVREKCAIALRGNHDAGALGDLPHTHFNAYGRSAIRWTKKKLTPKNVDYLRSLPFATTVDNITLAHASVPDPESWRYIVTWDEARRCFEGFSTRFCFIGHTHIPVIVSEEGRVNSMQQGKRHIINVGSVGQPRDGNPNAAFALVDGDRVEIVRVSYDVEKSARAILEAHLPDYLAQRLFVGT